MGADFDGDTVAVFGALPAPAEGAACLPPRLAWHPLLERPLFVPGKQYQYGLYRLMQNADRLADLRQALRQAGAPVWPEAVSVADAWGRWTEQAARTAPPASGGR